MNTQTEQSYTWLRKIPGSLFAYDEKPLLGFSPPFPWDKFSAEISRSLQTSSLAISPGELQWRSQEELFAGLGDKLRQVTLSVGPLTGNVWWVMPESSLVRFMELLLLKDPGTSQSTCGDPDFIKASSQFLAIEAMSAFQKMDFDKKLAPVVTQGATLPAEVCLCQDVTITFKGESFYGRLCLSSSFRKAWMQRYLQQKANLTTLPLADSVDVVVHLVAGKMDLKPSEWQQLAVGDFVIIDNCTIDPDEDQGRVMLVINGTPCFRAKVKQGSLKILEHPLYYEVDKFMATLPPKGKGSEDDDFDDADFEEITHPADAKKADAKSTPAADPKAKVPPAADPKSVKNAEPTHAKGEDSEFDDSDFDDDSGIEKAVAPPTGGTKGAEPKAAAAPAPATPPATGESKEAAPAAGAPPQQPQLSVDEIPLSVVIEVGRIQMSVKKLLELQPGNMLELDIHPESGVDMVVNGKRIAKGELLRIGDVLGIRIMELS